MAKKIVICKAFCEGLQVLARVARLRAKRRHKAFIYWIFAKMASISAICRFVQARNATNAESASSSTLRAHFVAKFWVAAQIDSSGAIVGPTIVFTKLWTQFAGLPAICSHQLSVLRIVADRCQVCTSNSRIILAIAKAAGFRAHMPHDAFLSRPST